MVLEPACLVGEGAGRLKSWGLPTGIWPRHGLQGLASASTPADDRAGHHVAGRQAGTARSCPRTVAQTSDLQENYYSNLADGETKAQAMIQGAQVYGLSFPFSCLSGQAGMAQSGFAPHPRPRQTVTTSKLDSRPFLPYVIGGGELSLRTSLRTWEGKKWPVGRFE